MIRISLTKEEISKIKNFLPDIQECGFKANFNKIRNSAWITPKFIQEFEVVNEEEIFFIEHNSESQIFGFLFKYKKQEEDPFDDPKICIYKTETENWIFQTQSYTMILESLQKVFEQIKNT